MNLTDIQPIKNCIFCSKRVSGKSFFANSKFSAIYNIAPVLTGHSLVIPNKHYTSLSELSDDELGEMMVFARKVTSVLVEVFLCDGFDWTIQDGVSAGQTVPHLHLHIIPRKLNDMAATDEWYSKIPKNEKQMLDSGQRERLSDHEYDAMTEKLSKAAALMI